MFTRRLMILAAVLQCVHAANAQEDETVPDSWSNELWREKLTSPTSNSKAAVRVNLGNALAQLNGDRAYEILGSCWKEIDPGTKKSILNGIGRGAGGTPLLNDSYFDVQHLGMTDPDQDVRRASLRYLRSHTFQPFIGTDNEYRAWRTTTRGEKADEIALTECISFVETLRTIDPENIPHALKRFRDTRNFIRAHDAMKTALLDAGLREAIDTRIAEGDLDRWDTNLMSLRSSLPLYETMAPDDPRDRVQYWLDQLADGLAARTEGEFAPGFLYFLQRLNEVQDLRSVPFYIGLIEADDSEHIIYYVGYFGLSRIVDVPFSRYHDAAWWRRWWTSGETGLDEEMLNIPIPKLAGPNIPNIHAPFPENMDTLDGKIDWMIQQIEAGDDRSAYDVAEEIAKHNSPESIPVLIGVIDADNSYDTIYGVGYFGLSELTGVSYSPYHDGAWWRRWWARNEMGLDESILSIPIPELPKTEHGKTHVPFPENMDTLEGKIEWMVKQIEAGEALRIHDISTEIAKHNSPESIPVLIGVIDADNSHDTIYGVGYSGLSKVTGVSYSPYHDGEWWRRWWARNEMNLDEDILSIPIPDLPKTEHGKTHVPFPENLDTLDGKLAFIVEQLEAGALREVHVAAAEIAEHDSPKAVPTLIAVIEADETQTTRTLVGHELSVLTGVPVDYSRNGAWWRKWWNTNKHMYPKEISELTIPTLRTPPAPLQTEAADQYPQDSETQSQPAEPQPQEADAQPEPAKAQPREKKAEPPVDPEFVGYPAQDLTIGEDENMRYFLIGPADAHEQPEDGYKLLLILPGGSGSADFHGFCRRIHKNAMPDGYVVAQLVAPVWVEDENRVVWPTRQLAPEQAEFKTEDFIKAVVDDVKERVEIDERYVFSLGWSSSGPPLYSQSLQEDSPITGTFIAMSVFKPDTLPDLSAAKDHPYYLLHSPEDFISIDRFARVAERKLRDAGAVTTLTTYRGGHGWREDPFGHIGRGVRWLQTIVNRRSTDSHR